MRKILKKILCFFVKTYFIYKAQRLEKRKIKDCRRVKILRQYNLTKEQKNEIDKLFKENYGKKVPYDWHRYYSSYTGNFDAKFIPELIYISIIERKFNDRKFTTAFSDKNLLPLYVDNMESVRTPETYVSCTKGVLRDKNFFIINKEEAVKILENVTCFGKPTIDSNSGKMCAVYRFENGIDKNSNCSVEDVIRLMGDNFCFQELVRNCDSVRILHEQSLNTFRITTYLWKGKVYHFPVIMRIGQGKSNLDNAHQGGMFIGLTDEGALRDCAYTEFQDRYYSHPNSNLVFKGYEVPELNMALSAVEKLHQRILQVGMISWDVVVNDKNEVIIIEMNVLGQSVWLSQMAHGVGAFGENTADILKWVKK